MKFEDLSPEVKWEARRIAAAFGVKQWEECDVEETMLFLGGWVSQHYVRCSIQHKTLCISELGVGSEDDVGTYFWQSLSAEFLDLALRKDGLEGEHALMARALYCLGFEGEAIIAQPPPLSAHEKLEARLTMPREFWPQKWLDEEAPDREQT